MNSHGMFSDMRARQWIRYVIDAQLFCESNTPVLQTFFQSAYIPYRVRGSLKLVVLGAIFRKMAEV